MERFCLTTFLSLQYPSMGSIESKNYFGHLMQFHSFIVECLAEHKMEG